MDKVANLTGTENINKMKIDKMVCFKAMIKFMHDYAFKQAHPIVRFEYILD